MQNPTQPFAAIGFFLLTAALIPALVDAETVFKCVKDGKASYTANPKGSDGQCQETKIEEQNPADLARALEEKRLRQEEDRKADEALLKEREVRAKELEAAASARRARALEEQLLLQQQSQQYAPPAVVYPYAYYPYWGGGLRPIQPVPPAGGGQQPASPGRSSPGGFQQPSRGTTNR